VGLRVCRRSRRAAVVFRLTLTILSGPTDRTCYAPAGSEADRGVIERIGTAVYVVLMGAAQEELVLALETLNQAVLAKLDGLGEYDLRRPLTPTGSTLLGIVKHLASVQAGYFGDTFARPWPEPMPWLAKNAEINADMFATATESSDWVRDFYCRSWIHAKETFAVTNLDDTGTVPWWPPERRHPTLRTVSLHMTVETARHAGHLDILREMVDGQAGRFEGDPSVPGDDEIHWSEYVAKVDSAAHMAAQGSSTGPISF